MVSVDDIRKRVAKYAASMDVEKRDERSDFLTIRDSQATTPPIIVHFVDQDIYSIEFLNNQFFELPENELLLVLDALLQGAYEVRNGVLRRAQSIRVLNNATKRFILPEAITGKADRRIYAKLPISFALK